MIIVDFSTIYINSIVYLFCCDMFLFLYNVRSFGTGIEGLLMTFLFV